jgi:prevent-host-death family protein
MSTTTDPSVTIHEAKTNLSRLLAEVEAGKEIVIKRGKHPVARLVPISAKPKRAFGQYEGLIEVPDSFLDSMTEEELALWEGGGI